MRVVGDLGGVQEDIEKAEASRVRAQSAVLTEQLRALGFMVGSSKDNQRWQRCLICVV